MRKVQRFFEVMRPGPSAVVLDVGFAPEGKEEGYGGFWAENLNPLARFKSGGFQIIALSIDPFGDAIWNYPHVQFVRGDGRALPFKAQAVDFVFSNAVVEHVGSRENQRQFVRECLRVAGKGVFITTPNYLFPVDPHLSVPFMHFLPRPLFGALARLVGHPGLSTVEGLNSLTAWSLQGCFAVPAHVHVEGIGLPLLPETLVAWVLHPLASEGGSANTT